MLLKKTIFIISSFAMLLSMPVQAMEKEEFAILAAIAKTQQKILDNQEAWSWSTRLGVGAVALAGTAVVVTGGYKVYTVFTTRRTIKNDISNMNHMNRALLDSFVDGMSHDSLITARDHESLKSDTSKAIKDNEKEIKVEAKKVFGQNAAVLAAYDEGFNTLSNRLQKIRSFSVYADYDIFAKKSEMIRQAFQAVAAQRKAIIEEAEPPLEENTKKVSIAQKELTHLDQQLGQNEQTLLGMLQSTHQGIKATSEVIQNKKVYLAYLKAVNAVYETSGPQQSTDVGLFAANRDSNTVK